MAGISRNVPVSEQSRSESLKSDFSIFYPANNNDCSHYRSTITFQRLLNGQNNYVIVPCETIDEVATGCSSDPIEILLEEISPSGIYQITTANAEAINAEVEMI